jgi:hypothetical protein
MVWSHGADFKECCLVRSFEKNFHPSRGRALVSGPWAS